MNDMTAFELVDRCHPSFPATLATKPNAELVRTELQRILSSSSFNASERNRRFLTYVVDEFLKVGANASRLITSLPVSLVATKILTRNLIPLCVWKRVAFDVQSSAFMPWTANGRRYAYRCQRAGTSQSFMCQVRVGWVDRCKLSSRPLKWKQMQAG